MKVHIFSKKLEVLEYGEDELPSPEAIGEQVRSDLAQMGAEPWACIELEAFTYKRGTLVFASPARLLLPGFLTAFLEGD